MAIRKGSIVEVELNPPADGEGGYVKRRPAVVLVVDVEMATCTVVGISTKLGIGDQNFFVELPFSQNRSSSSGNTKSGLHEKCVAKCYWYDKVPVSNCKKIGFVSTRKLIEILDLVLQHEASLATDESSTSNSANNDSEE